VNWFVAGKGHPIAKSAVSPISQMCQDM